MRWLLWVQFFLLTGLTVNSSLYGIDRVPVDSAIVVDTVTPPVKQGFQPVYMFALGSTYRLDEQEIINEAPSIYIKFLYTFIRNNSVKLGVGYTSLDFESLYGYPGGEVNIYAFEWGVRWHYSILKFLPYVEMGLEFKHYNSSVPKVTQPRIGWQFGAGVQVPVTEYLSCEFGITQSVNDVNIGTLDNLPSSSQLYDPENQTIGIFNGRFYPQLYNPTSLSFMLLYNL